MHIRATSGLQGLDNLSPKLSMQTEIDGRCFTVTGILPKSEFQTKAVWLDTERGGNC